VDAVAPEIEEEGAAFAFANELRRLRCLTIDDVFARRAIGDRADLVFGIGDPIGLHAVG
jgi:hypothetical protein